MPALLLSDCRSCTVLLLALNGCGCMNYFGDMGIDLMYAQLPEIDVKKRQKY